MPTGYTCIIEDGTPTFRDYALRCARGMMPCIMQRDESLSNPPRLQEPSDYHAKEAEKARARLAKLATMSAADCEHAARTEHAKAMGYWQKAVDASAAKSAKYETMRSAVLAWKAPTPEHEGLRAFMLDQINISTEYSGAHVVREKVARHALAEAMLGIEATTVEEYRDRAHALAMNWKGEV